MDITLRLIENTFGIARLDAAAAVPGWAVEGKWFSVTRTADELSIVAESALIPGGVNYEGGWRALKIDGILDFAEIGIIAGISSALALDGVSVFVISTYNTDYILIKASSLEKGMRLLRESGYNIEI